MLVWQLVERQEVDKTKAQKQGDVEAMSISTQVVTSRQMPQLNFSEVVGNTNYDPSLVQTYGSSITRGT